MTDTAVTEWERRQLERLRPLAAECAVLLRSDGAFPLGETGELALYGSGARHTLMGGTGSGEVNTRGSVNAEQGLEAAGFTITSKAWLDAYDGVLDAARRDFVKEIAARARKKHTLAIVEGMGAVMPEPEYDLPLDGAGNTAVYVLSRISGEGSDRRAVAGDLLLSASELRDVLALQSRYERFLLVLNVGGPVDLSPLGEVRNVLLLSQLGAETGHVLADLVTGKAYPSGKLTASWSAWGAYCEEGEFGEPEDTRYREGVYVGYRYFDSVGRRPLFPFGFGLGYTSFSVACAGVAAESGVLRVEAAVTNTGARAGRETVQLYVSVPARTLDAPYQGLAAFAKTRELAPGETETLTLSCRMVDLASYDTVRRQWFLDAGDYLLRLGTSSADTAVCGVARLDEAVVTRRTRNRCGVPGFADWKPVRRGEPGAPDGVPVVSVQASALAEEAPEPAAAPEIGALARSLSDEELAYLNVGAFAPGKLDTVIGDSARSVAGAAGESTDRLRRRGIGTLVMADGPAGLRLSRQYVTDAKGVAHPLAGSVPQSMLTFLPDWQAKAIRSLTRRRPRRGETVGEQYATAIPIGTAIAQSWDLALAEACGDVVGGEMERFGVDLWLAPALNIQRDVRCGRNFEYFSEDPLLSGKFAAAITRGVQSHPGRGATVKHYAANNQETERYNSNSQVSERAMREIYLRGFEICIREAQPFALMTSYNLLNGIHTSEHLGLAQILRDEFGFTGVVMTDWIIARGMLSRKAKYPAPVASKIAATGCSLVMPGSQADVRDILRALRRGTLSRGQLEQNAERILEVMKRCGKN